ncbi:MULTISPECIES: cytochrome P450 [unclassified Sphingopyxis]|uniref:cytochrome P450 n=1 Tax=unclassified Sphingopyxis TaxID=2614943 RepID=UPI00285A2F00|nr:MULTISPECIES: cytochrome P450 [unclassified Sphingopyxis]MDR6833433.1 cytochrome P450 [Sphingopyxis sp. BE122]MDR7225702.1 cytochrome P450 [Sphingopyxis sp. BE259]
MNDIAASSFFEPQVIADPFDYYRTWLPKSPVVQLSDGMFLVLSYEHCAQATGDVETFSNNFQGTLSGAMAEDGDVAAILAEGWPQVDTLLTADPPTHTRFRKLVNLAFSMKRVAAIEEDMRGVVIDLVERMAAKQSCDFVTDFAIPLPVAMIASQIGMTGDDLAKVKRWSDAFVDRLGRMIPKERELECAREVVEFQHFVKAKIDERRANPTDDLLSDLVHAAADGERPLEDAEILSIMQQLMVAGNETTTSALAGGLLQLIDNPDQMAKAVAAADAGNDRAIINLVEEVLRTESPTAGMWRMVLRDAELGGVKIPHGAMVQLRYAAANRDPAKYPDPDRFDIERANARSHLAFGKGIHMCVGNMLSRKEMAVAYTELLTRLTDFAVADGHAPSWPPNMLLRGLTTLPITYRRRA